MNVLLDENFPASAASVVETAGHSPISFSEACEFGADDETVFAAAQSSDALILTSDRDFYHTMPLRHPHHDGIVVVALRQPSSSASNGSSRPFCRPTATRCSSSETIPAG